MLRLTLISLAQGRQAEKDKMQKRDGTRQKKRKKEQKKEQSSQKMTNTFNTSLKHGDAQGLRGLAMDIRGYQAELKPMLSMDD